MAQMLPPALPNTPGILDPPRPPLPPLPPARSVQARSPAALKAAKAAVTRKKNLAADRQRRLKNLAKNLGESTVEVTLLAANGLIGQPYQRRLEEERAFEIALNFDWDELDPLVVSDRLVATEGHYTVVDGQHRLVAFRLVHGDNTSKELPCKIVHGYSYEREAQLYVRLNKDRKPLSFNQRFKGRVESQEGEALVLIRILASFGLRPYYDTDTRHISDGDIKALSTVEEILKGGGHVRLTTILDLLHLGFGLKHEAYRQEFLRGMHSFLHRYEAHPNFRLKRLVDTLQSFDYQALYVASIGTAASMRCNRSTGLAYNVWLKFNYNRRSTHRLPPFSFESEVVDTGG